MNTVTRIENTFTDRFIADCARVSFGTTAEDYSDEQVGKLIDYLVRNKHVNPMFHPMVTVRLSQSQIQLHKLAQNKSLMAGLNLYKEGKEWIATTSAWGLMELGKHCGGLPYYGKVMDAFFVSYENHRWEGDKGKVVVMPLIETPRHHQWFTFAFETEMNTKAQLYTHTVGLAKSSESFRYVDKIRFYTPHEWRGKADNVKQGSSDELVKDIYVNYPITVNHGGEQATYDIPLCYNDILDISDNWYTANHHICNEQRRYILPQAQMSRYVVTGTREAWERVIRLRCDPHAQKEIRLLIEQVADLIASDTTWR